MNVTEQTCRIAGGAEAPEVRLLPIAGGTAAAFSARHPAQDGENQDGAVLIRVDSTRGVLAVADGMGGSRGGASASQTVLRCLEESLKASNLRQGGSLRAAILDSVERANRTVLEWGIGAGTTFTAAALDESSLRPYHVGDSGILVVGQRGRVKLQTVTHSPVGYGIEAGLIDEREALHHSERHLVSNVIGTADMRIDVGSKMNLAPRDTVVLATDGLFDNVEPKELVEIVRTKPLESVARMLTELCRRRMTSPTEGQPSKPDDHTFILFRRNHHPSRRPAAS